MPSDLIQSALPDPRTFGDDPLNYLTDLYLLFLQGLFKQRPEGSWRWSDDERLSEITITDQAPFPMDRIAQRPAIIVMLGPGNFGNLTLGNMEQTDIATGKERLKDMVAATMTIACITKATGREAKRIAWWTARHLRIFRKLLQRNGFHEVGAQLSVGAEAPPGSLISPASDEEAVMVTIQSPFFFTWNEEITPLYAPMLREIAAKLETAYPVPESSLREIRMKPPAMRGQLIAGVSRPIDSAPVTQTVKS